ARRASQLTEISRCSRAADLAAMVGAVRRRSGYVYRRRRRGPRPSVVFVLVALIAVLGVAAAVMAATQGTGSSAGGAGGPPARAPGGPPAGGTRHAAAPRSHHHRGRRSPALSRRQRVDAREIGAVLRYTPFVSIGSRRHRVIALTFDDGPSPYTGPIVRILAR